MHPEQMAGGGGVGIMVHESLIYKTIFEYNDNYHNIL